MNLNLLFLFLTCLVFAEMSMGRAKAVINSAEEIENDDDFLNKLFRDKQNNQQDNLHEQENADFIAKLAKLFGDKDNKQQDAELENSDFIAKLAKLFGDKDNKQQDAELENADFISKLAKLFGDNDIKQRDAELENADFIAKLAKSLLGDSYEPSKDVGLIGKAMVAKAALQHLKHKKKKGDNLEKTEEDDFLSKLFGDKDNKQRDTELENSDFIAKLAKLFGDNDNKEQDAELENSDFIAKLAKSLLGDSDEPFKDVKKIIKKVTTTKRTKGDNLAEQDDLLFDSDEPSKDVGLIGKAMVAKAALQHLKHKNKKGDNLEKTEENDFLSKLFGDKDNKQQDAQLENSDFIAKLAKSLLGDSDETSKDVKKINKKITTTKRTKGDNLAEQDDLLFGGKQKDKSGHKHKQQQDGDVVEDDDIVQALKAGGKKIVDGLKQGWKGVKQIGRGTKQAFRALKGDKYNIQVLDKMMDKTTKQAFRALKGDKYNIQVLDKMMSAKSFDEFSRSLESLNSDLNNEGNFEETED